MDTPKLSTMVVLYKLNLKLKTDELLRNLPINDKIIKVEKRGVLRRGESSRDKIRRRSKKNEKTSTTGFGHNSITIVMMNDGSGTQPMKEITIKIFQNGVFHLTGILHDNYDKSCIDILLNTIWDDCHDCITEPPDAWKIERVVLMNYTTELLPKTTVAREALYNAIRGNEGVLTSYNPDVYPGVKIQFMPSKWTAKVFRTGKIILTGITTHEDCLTFVGELNELLGKALPKSH
jgi:TATA-box binding protein (TBP) (component of TFIID and TFIIIB)